jgi:hypothetical protein
MYYLEARVYETENDYRCWAEFWVRCEKTEEPTMTAHVHLQRVEGPEVLEHEEIMLCIRAACAEIAQNLEDSLF